MSANRRRIKNLEAQLRSYISIIQGILMVLFFSSFKTGRKLKNLKAKQRNCIVIANGPSLDKEINSIIQNRDSSELMALNFFCNTEYFKLLKPEYYCIADPGAFNSKNKNPILQKRIKNFLESFNEIDWECHLFYPHHFDKSIVLDSIKNPLIKKHKYNSVPLSSNSKLIFYLYSRGLLLPIPESVIISSIYLAILLSFEKIHLFGVDHSWIKDFKVNKDNTTSIRLEHFGDSTDDTDNEKSISKFMISQYRLFNSHDVLNTYSKHKNVQIINNTFASYIDSYKRISD